MARIAVGGFRHETNTFAPTPATWDDFEKGYSWPPLTRGEGLFEAMRGYNLALSGFLEAAASGHELVPLLWASASPSGAVLEEVYERIVAMLLEEIEAALPLDAVYLSLHGAMVAEHVDDGEGELLRRLRDRIGSSVPVVASLDYHANVSTDLVRHATALVSYRSYPHVDMAETGRRAFVLLSEILDTGRRPAKAWRQLPFLIPLPWGCTTTEPAASVFRRLQALERCDGVTSLSFAAGFPAADIPDCGPSVLGYGADSEAVEAAVGALAEEISAREPAWAGRTLGPEEAVEEAMRRARRADRPIVLADIQDNPGAGGTADTMGLVKALIRAGAEGAVAGLICAPHVATIAHRVGEGAEIHVSLGGKHGIVGDSSLDATLRVEKLCDGQVLGTGPFYGGARMDLAPMACLSIGGVKVVVAGKKVQAADRAMFRAVGIEPGEQKILALKSSVHFRADFEPIADSILMVEAPGPMVVDPGRLPFAKLRRGVRRRPGDATSTVEPVGERGSPNV